MQNHQHQPTITPSAPPLPITTTTTTTTTETSAASTTIPAPPPYYESVTDPTPSTRQPENLTASLYNRLMQSSIQLPSCLSWCLWPCKICQKCQARHSLPLMTIKWRDIPSSTLDRFYISTHTHSYEQVGVTWLGYALAQFVALMFVWGFVSDGLTVASFIVNDRSVLAVAYSVLMVLNFGLFAVDAKRARAVIDSDGVAEAFVCQAAYNYYILRYGYRWFCVFEAVEGTRKPKHRLAFFVYFGLRGWGRLLFRDGLRIVLSLMAIIMAGAEQEPYRLVMFFVNIVLHGVFVARFFLALALWVPTKCIVRLRSLESYCCLIMNKNLMQLIQQDASTTSLQQVTTMSE